MELPIRMTLLMVTIGYVLMSIASAAEDLGYVDEHWKAPDYRE